MSAKLGVRVKFTGPIFKRGGEPVKKMMSDLMREVGEKGEERFAATLRPRPSGVYLSVQQGGKSTGNYRRVVQRSISIKSKSVTFTDGNVVYGSWLEGTSRRNMTTRFKGYRTFRRVRDFLEKKAMPVLLKKHMRRLQREVGG